MAGIGELRNSEFKGRGMILGTKVSTLFVSVALGSVLFATSGCSNLKELGPTLWTRPSDEEPVDAPKKEKVVAQPSVGEEKIAQSNLPVETTTGKEVENQLKESDSKAVDPAVGATTTQTIEVAPNTVVTQNPKPPAQTASLTQQGPGARVQPVEILWRVPTDTVERYQILWGNDESNLDQKVVVEVRDLTKVDHPKFGPVFRYELRQVPMDQAIYLSLRAENRFGISQPTPPVRLDPGKRTIAP